MDEEFLRAIESKKYLDDQVTLSQVQQLAFGKTVLTTVGPTADANVYKTLTSGVTSLQSYIKK